MRRATASVSPIINLHRIGALDLLPQMFEQIWMPSVVLEDLLDARFLGYNVPSPFDLPWVEYHDPELTIPAVWVSLDLSSGEVAAIALAFENKDCIVLIDEPIGRIAAKGVGIKYWGTLQVLLEAKARGLIPSIIPYIKRLQNSGMFMTDDIVQRVLRLANETDGGVGPLSLLLRDEEEATAVETKTEEAKPEEKQPEKPAEKPGAKVIEEKKPEGPRPGEKKPDVPKPESKKAGDSKETKPSKP